MKLTLARFKPKLTLTIVMALAALAGCGGGINKVPLYPASGKVQVDGQPAKGIKVRLFPANALNDPNALRPFATTADDGTFQLGTYEDEDGAPEGNYKVTLFWPDRPPGPSHPNDLLGGAYANVDQSRIDVTINKSTTTLQPFDLKKTAPPAKQPTTSPPKTRTPDSDGV